MITATAPTCSAAPTKPSPGARTMLTPHRAEVIDCETTDLPGAISGKVGYKNLLNRTPELGCLSHKSTAGEELSVSVPQVKDQTGPPVGCTSTV
jgi:hypothetical protein